MEDFEDFAEREAVAGPDGKLLQKAALCGKCGKIKPVLEFKRKLTRAQSMARGYPGVRQVEIDSSLCKDCQPRKRGYTEMTRKEIKNLVATGDMHAMLAESILTRRDKELSQKRHHELSLQWKRAGTETWGNILGDVRTELARVQQQEKNAKIKAPALPLDFFHEYKAALAKAREDLKFALNVKNAKPTHADWQAYVPLEVQARLKELWEDLPLSYRTHVKQPAIVVWAFKAASPAVSRTLKKHTTPSPAERLAHGGKLEH